MSLSNIFPVPTSPLEEYFLRDSRLGYPMTMPLLFFFRGKANLGALEEAFAKTVLHEPLFCAFLQRHKHRRYWQIAPEVPRLVIETDALIEEHSGSEGIERIVSLDPLRTPGVHCRYVPMADGFAIRLQIHHAICDGLGSIVFLGNWMAEYARLVGDDSDLTANHPVPERIKLRTDLHIELPHPLSRWTIIRSFIKELRIWFTRPVYRFSPQEVTNIDHTISDNIDSPVLLWGTISSADIVRIRQKAQSMGVSLNSYLTGLYFQHLCNCLGVKKKSDGRWIRLLVPTNLRKPIHSGIPASNMIGYSFLDRRARECTDSEAFYRSIDSDIDFVKKWSMAAMFITGVDMVQRIPFALSLVLSSRNCLATSVFSNIGNPIKVLPYPRFKDSGTIEVGGIKLDRIVGAPPIRPNTPFCCGLIQQNGEMTLSMIVDSARLGLENCRKFHRTFIDHIVKAAS